jgi:hypothetical protein
LKSYAVASFRDVSIRRAWKAPNWGLDSKRIRTGRMQLSRADAIRTAFTQHGEGSF